MVSQCTCSRYDMGVFRLSGPVVVGRRRRRHGTVPCELSVQITVARRQKADLPFLATLREEPIVGVRSHPSHEMRTAVAVVVAAVVVVSSWQHVNFESDNVLVDGDPGDVGDGVELSFDRPSAFDALQHTRITVKGLEALVATTDEFHGEVSGKPFHRTDLRVRVPGFRHLVLGTRSRLVDLIEVFGKGHALAGADRSGGVIIGFISVPGDVAVTHDVKCPSDEGWLFAGKGGGKPKLHGCFLGVCVFWLLSCLLEGAASSSFMSTRAFERTGTRDPFALETTPVRKPTKGNQVS